MLALLLTLFHAPVPVEPKVEPPKGSAPAILVAGVDKEGRLFAERMRTRYVTQQRTVNQVVNGKAVTKVYTVMVPVTETYRQHWSLDKAAISEAGGKKLDKEALAKRLAKPAVIVMSSDGKSIDAGYLKLFQKDTLVVVIPAPPSKIPPPVPPRKEE
jgi:hypothetical protein